MGAALDDSSDQIGLTDKALELQGRKPVIVGCIKLRRHSRKELLAERQVGAAEPASGALRRDIGERSTGAQPTIPAEERGVRPRNLHDRVTSPGCMPFGAIGLGWQQLGGVRLRGRVPSHIGKAVMPASVEYRNARPLLLATVVAVVEGATQVHDVGFTGGRVDHVVIPALSAIAAIVNVCVVVNS